MIRIKEERKKDIKYICQGYKDHARFASVFDTRFRIPVYSAYQIKKLNGKVKEEGGSTTWKYEPQLENKDYNQMGMIGKLGLNQNQVKNQATDEEYEHSGWDKGHLFPNAYNVSMLVFNYYHILYKENFIFMCFFTLGNV